MRACIHSAASRDGFAHRRRLRPTAGERLVEGDRVERAARTHVGECVFRLQLAALHVEHPELNAVFPRGHARSPKVRAFVDFLLERLNLDIDYTSAHCPYAKCDGVDVEAAPEGGESDAELGKRILEVVTAGTGER